MEAKYGLVCFNNVFGVDIKDDYYFYSLQERSIYRRPRKSEKDCADFIKMTAHDFKPRLRNGACGKFKWRMCDVIQWLN